jgi:hypothetical protein
MKKALIILLAGFPLFSGAGDYQTSLIVQTGKFRESDLIVRTISDLETNKICLAFYVRTTGTSPAMNCYEGKAGFRTSIHQVGHFKEGKLIIRKLKDSINAISCLVAYVSTSGTSPAIDCYTSTMAPKDAIVRQGHLREGDLDVHQIVDPDSTETCLVAYVSTNSTSPALRCYKSQGGGKGGLLQTGYMREGDLIVRKIVDEPNGKECLISYVSTEGTHSHIHCFDKAFPTPSQPEARSLPQYRPEQGEQ